MMLDLLLASHALVFFFVIAAPAGGGGDPPEVCRRRGPITSTFGDGVSKGLPEAAEAPGPGNAEATGRWWLWTDLNCRPNDYESFALTN